MKKTFIINGEAVTVEQFAQGQGEIRFALNGRHYQFNGHVQKDGQVVLQDAARNRRGFVGKKNARGTHPVMLQGLEASVHPLLPGRKQSDAGGKARPHTAPMPGMVQKVLVSVGDQVEAGQKLLVMEAMKLQLAIEAAYAGEVKNLLCQPGGLVADGDLLVEITAA